MSTVGANQCTTRTEIGNQTAFVANICSTDKEDEDIKKDEEFSF